MHLLVFFLAVAAPCEARAEYGMIGEHTDSTKYAMVDGFRVAYEVTGDTEPAVVFVHGWSAARSHWYRQDGAFGNRRLVLLDLPGHGESDRPESGYGVSFLARAVEAVLDSARIERAILVGHSNGVPIVRHVQRRQPGRIAGLIGVDGPLRNTLRPDVAEWMRKTAASPDFPQLHRRMVQQTPTGGLSPEDAELVRRGARATPVQVLMGGLELLEDPETFREDPIPVPLLLLHAESPQWAGDYPDFVRRLAPHVEIHVWQGVSHFLYLERPDAFNEIVRDFVARVAES